MLYPGECNREGGALKEAVNMISESSRPLTRGDLQRSDLNDGSVLYDRTGEMTYTLNLTASLIWSYLDGDFSLEEIAGEVASAVDTDKDTVLSDVLRTVATFHENGLLDRAD
jgi:Coenzyme PQQ synthesis protein D (PqqD)